MINEGLWTTQRMIQCELLFYSEKKYPNNFITTYSVYSMLTEPKHDLFFRNMCLWLVKIMAVKPPSNLENTQTFRVNLFLPKSHIVLNWVIKYMVRELGFNFFDEGEVSCYVDCFWIIFDSLSIRKLWSIHIFQNVISWKGEKMFFFAICFLKKMLSLYASLNGSLLEQVQK